VVAATGLLAAAWLAAVASLRPHAVPPGAGGADESEWTGVIHVHSRYSHDARGTIEEIAAAAARTGVHVVFLTDHNTLAPLVEGKEGWYGSTLVLIGTEITTGSGYLLVLDPRPGLPVKARGFALDDLVSRYHDAGAIVLMAHADHPRLGWRGELPPVHGLEVIDLFDQLVAAPTGRQALGLLAYPVNPLMAILSVVRWPKAGLAWWNRLAAQQPTIGVLGLDAHGGIELTEEAGIRFPSHETAFRIGRLHFVGTDPPVPGRDERARVYRALREGRFYNAFDGLGATAGFRFEMRRGTTRVPMGGTVSAGPGLVAEIRVPGAGEVRVRLLRDGTAVYDGPPGHPLRVPVEGPGAYRVEVDLATNLLPLAVPGSLPWIFANPIYVRP
jgi:hypothetical protein